MTDDEKQRALISAEVFGTSAGAPPVVEEPQLKAEPVEAAPPKVEEVPVDEWAGVSPALRATVEALRAKVEGVDAMETRLKQSEQRVGSLTNELRDIKKAKEDPPAEAPSAVKLREQYPELSPTMEERIAAVSADVLAKVPQIDAKTLAETVAKTVKAEVAFDLACDRVEEMHPGWQVTKETPEFRTWQKTASADVQKLALSSRATDAIKMFDAYAAFRKTQKSPAEIEAARLARLEQAQTIPGRKTPAVKAESDMTPVELRAHIAAQVFK